MMCEDPEDLEGSVICEEPEDSVDLIYEILLGIFLAEDLGDLGDKEPKNEKTSNMS